MVAPRISISDNVAQIWAKLNVAKKQVPFVTAVALTRTGQVLAQNTLPNRTREVFDRPTRFTQNAFRSTVARRDRLVTVVYVKDFAGKGTPPSRYLRPQISGGYRDLKRFEHALQTRGLMPKGMQAVPGPGAEIDQHGNMRAAQIITMLSALQAFSEVGYVANRRAKSRGVRRADNFFVPGPASALKPGVYQNLGQRGVVPVLLFVSPHNYRVRWEFEADVRKVVPRIFTSQFEVAWAEVQDRGLRP